jgi:hypothetical protein
MGGIKRAMDMCFSCGEPASTNLAISNFHVFLNLIYTHHPKTHRWLLSPRISEKPPDTPESPKLTIRFKSSRFSGQFSGIFGKSGVSGKFPRISEASLDNTCHLGEKVIIFYFGLRIR